MSKTKTVRPLYRNAEVSSVNTENRTFDLVWTTGAKVLRSNWLDGPFWEELSTDPAHVRLERLQSGSAPFLANHDSGDVAATLGVIESARLEKGRGVATVRFVSEGIDPEADKVFAKIADRIIKNVSVGYRTFKIEKTETADGTIPTHLATDWEPHEISAVAIGADAGAGIRTSEATNEVIITTKKRRSTMEVDENEEAIRQQERERISGIQAAVRIGKLGDDFAQRMINGKVSLAQAREAVLEELATRSDAIKTENHVPITGGEDSSDKFMRGATSALLMRAAPDLVHDAKKRGVPGFESVDTGPSEFRNLNLVDFARESLRRNGVRTGSLSRLDLVGRAFTTRSGGPYAGTGDFPVLLENTLGKVLLGAYAITPDTWSKICKTDSVDDFRTSPRYRTGSISVLDSLNENGEFKNKAIPDAAKLSISTATKGNIVAISRQLIINDDLAGLSDLLSKMGRAARLSIEVDFYALLAQNGGLGPTLDDGFSLFHANHANIGVGSALSVAGIDADRVVMGSQKDAQSNEYLDLRPRVLLVPLGKGGEARVLNTSAIDPTSSTTLQKPNMVNGLFSEVVDTARITGTRRYLFGDNAIAPAFVVAFLNGQQSPFLESEPGWRVDGTEMKVRFDYRVQAFDYRGAVTNAGA